MLIRRLAVLFAAVGLIASCATTAVPLARPTGTPAITGPSSVRSAPIKTPMSSSHPHRHLINRAVWESEPEGQRLIVHPSLVGRNHASETPKLALREALVKARPSPRHLTAAMRQSLLNQLRCHAAFAVTKPTWDLEDWRPNVGYYATVEALCNP